MPDLRLLGALDLTGARGERLLSVLAQPKRVALLAYLTIAAPGDFHRRDKLLALFWPESDAEHARNSLRQALHFLRHALGATSIPSRGDAEIGVDSACVSCDVVAFEAAVREDPAKALELYRGDLLEGFFLPDAREFEHWLETERTRLRGLAVTAAQELAERAEQSGDYETALRCIEKSRTLAPADEILLRRLVELLDRVGNRTAALGAYNEFADRVRGEYGLEPSPETVAKIEVIRARLDPVAADEPDRSATRPPTAIDRDARGHAHESSDRRESTRRIAAFRRQWLRPILIGVASGLALLLVADITSSRAPQGGQQSLKRIAVLPFRNLSGDSDDAYFTEGFQEELLTRLAKISAFRVTARSSVLGYGADPPDLNAVARELGVRYLIQGSVQRRSDQVKISARLVDSATGEELWGNTYGSSRLDLFSIQVEVAERIANALQVHFSPEERSRIAARPTLNAAAYEAYLRGKVHWSRGVNREDAEWAAKFFEWATILDPQFAKAQASLAYARVWLAYVFGEHEQLESARQALDRAVLLDDNGVETLLAQAYYLSYVTRDYEAALGRASRVVQLQPSHAEAYALMGFNQRRQGNWENAAATMTHALELDPNSYNATVVLGEMYLRMRKLNEAERLFDRAIAISPQGELAYAQKVLLHLYGRGDTAAAQRILQQAPATFSARYRTLQGLTAVLRRDYDRGLALLASPPNSDGAPGSMPEDLLLHGLIHRWKGRSDLARECADSIRMLLAESRPPGEAARAAGSTWPLALAHSYTAMANVLTGQPDDAVAEAERAAALIPLSVDVHDGTEIMRRLADIYALTGRTAEAVRTLEVLLSIPSRTTVHMLRLHPIYDSVRTDPQFQRLLARHGYSEQSMSISVPVSH